MAAALATTQWFGQGAFYGPAALDPMTNSSVTNAGVLRPVRDVHPLSECFQIVIIALILALLFASGPAYVARFIVAVGIDPIERVIAGARADMGQERWEVVTPDISHRDASRAVSRIGDVRHLEASLFGCSPCAIFSRADQAVRRVLSDESFTVDAPATRRVPASQLVRVVNENLSAAIASTPPRSSASFIGRSTEYDQSSEAVTRQVVESRHVGIVSQITRSES